MPAPPIPATALPTMRVVLFLATAQIKELILKMNIAPKKVLLRGKYLYPLPHVDWNEVKVRKKALIYHPTYPNS
jgi:hypothetical protein